MVKTKEVGGNAGSDAAQAALAERGVHVIVTGFRGVNWREKCKVAPIFVIYNRPRDLKRFNFVVRAFDGSTPLRLLAVADTLEEARKTIPDGFLRMPPSPIDDPIIVETWM